MKEFFKIFLALSISLLSLFALFSCGDGDEPCTHTWDDGEIKVKATCKKEGDCLFTCTLCGETKTEKITGEHTYENDICTLCGTFNDKIKNPNLVLIDSIFNEKGVQITGENVSVSLNNSIDLTFTSCGANLKVVNSYLVGEIWAHGTSHGEAFDARVELRDEMIYLFGDHPRKLLGNADPEPSPLTAEKPSETPYATYSQKELVQRLPLNLYSALFEDKNNAENIGSVWDSLIAADDNIVEKKLNSLMNLLFIKSQTIDEYRYNINPSLVKSLLESAKAKSMSEFIDILLGKNFSAGAFSLVSEALGKTVSQIEAITKTTLFAYGISINDIISIIENIAGIDIDKELDEIKDYKIYELINEYSESPKELDEYRKLLMETEEKMNTSTLFSIVINPLLEKYLTLSYDEIAEIILYLVDSSSLELVVSPSYELIKATESFESIEINEEINERQINLTFSGSFEFKINK